MPARLTPNLPLAKGNTMNIREVELMRKLQRQYYKELELDTQQKSKGGYVVVNVHVLLAYRLLSLLALTILLLMYFFPPR
jgi:hypothetical protein